MSVEQARKGRKTDTTKKKNDIKIKEFKTRHLREEEQKEGRRNTAENEKYSRIGKNQKDIRRGENRDTKVG